MRMISDRWQDVWGIQRAWERRESRGEVGVENLMGRGHLAYVKVGG